MHQRAGPQEVCQLRDSHLVPTAHLSPPSRVARPMSVEHFWRQFCGLNVSGWMADLEHLFHSDDTVIISIQEDLHQSQTVTASERRESIQGVRSANGSLVKVFFVDNDFGVLRVRFPKQLSCLVNDMERLVKQNHEEVVTSKTEKRQNHGNTSTAPCLRWDKKTTHDSQGTLRQK